MLFRTPHHTPTNRKRSTRSDADSPTSAAEITAADDPRHQKAAQADHLQHHNKSQHRKAATLASATITTIMVTALKSARSVAPASTRRDSRETGKRGNKCRPSPRHQKRQSSPLRTRLRRLNKMAHRWWRPLVHHPSNPSTTRVRTQCLEITGSKRIGYFLLRSRRTSSLHRGQRV